MSEEESAECRRCQTPMDRGFVLDLYGCTNEAWIAGDPETGRFGVGIKIRRRPHYPIITFRCPQCGLLESYAPKQRQWAPVPERRDKNLGGLQFVLLPQPSASGVADLEPSG